MATKKKMLQAAAGNAGGAGLDITEVFSTYLYDGTGSARSIVNEIDLAGEGGIVWLKSRSDATPHTLHTTDIGALNYLVPNNTSGNNAGLAGYGLTAFNSNGFSLGTDYEGENGSGKTYASWTFRKAPKFFDVVTYTGTGSAQNISHNLGSVPGMIIVKQTNATNNWWVQHIAFGGSHRLQLNATDAAETTSSVWNNTDPTSTVFTVGAHTGTNASNGTYVAYLFAHNNNDGGFGPDADQDIIKCGSLTDGGAAINLGFEPQFVLIKRTDTDSVNPSSGSRASKGNWMIADVMRSMPVSDQVDGLAANLSDAEIHDDFYIKPTPTGFSYDSLSYDGTGDFIYMAIRRGPLAPPEAGTEVFAVVTYTGDNSTTSGQLVTSGFAVDMGINRYNRGGAGDWDIDDRVRGLTSIGVSPNSKYLNPYNSNAEGSGGYIFNATNTGVDNYGFASDKTQLNYLFRRAPSFFDVVAYSGNSVSGRAVSHSVLGVAPEMIWVKCRSHSGENWAVYHSALGASSWLELNNTSSTINGTTRFAGVAPTSSVFSLGIDNSVNSSGKTYIAYLFASLAGVSKVGSYVGDGTNNRQIDCGFTTGARFILAKNTTGGRWDVFDTARGIGAGNPPRLSLNNTNAEESPADYVDPHPSGFIVNSPLNDNGDTWIFYAIA